MDPSTPLLRRPPRAGTKKLNTIFSSQTFRGLSGYPAKKFDFPDFEGHTELFGPTPSRGRPPPHRRSGLQSLGLCSFFVPERGPFSYPGVSTLSDPTEITPPPYRETGVAIPLSHCVSCGIADYRCYTPASVRKSGLSQSKDRPNKGVSQNKLASEAYRAVGGVARNSIANRAKWDYPGVSARGVRHSPDFLFGLISRILKTC